MHTLYQHCSDGREVCCYWCGGPWPEPWQPARSSELARHMRCTQFGPASGDKALQRHDDALRTVLADDSSDDAVPVPYDEFDIATESSVAGSGSYEDEGFGGSWHLSDIGSEDGSGVYAAAAASSSSQRQERDAWLEKYLSVSDVAYNERLVQEADRKWPMTQEAQCKQQ